MRGSRIFCQAGGGGGGGGGVEARRPENSLDNVFLVINLFYSLQSGSNGFITEGRVGCPKKPILLVIFQGGSGPPNPPLDPHVGSPDAHCLLTESWSGWGGGGVEARRPENSLDNVFFSHQLILQFTEWIQWFYYRGEGGVSKETDITCDFPGGGPDPLTPLWIRTWGRLTPLFAYRIMVYQNLNKTEKYHPKTT